DCPGGKLVEQSQQRRNVPVLHEVHAVLRECFDGEGGVVTGECVIDGLAKHPVPGEPPRSGQVQTHDSVRVVAFEATAQELQEHGVESKPGAFFVDVPEKQVAVLGVLEHRLAAYVTGQLGGETSADAVRDGDGE